jgi:hypothetical protein
MNLISRYILLLLVFLIGTTLCFSQSKKSKKNKNFTKAEADSILSLQLN